MDSPDLQADRNEAGGLVYSGRFVAYSRFSSGHRRSYMDIVSRLFPGARVVNRRGLLYCALDKDPLFFLMIEEDFLLYVGLGMVRHLLGRRTVGLLFRLRESIEPRKPVHRIKNALLRLTRMTGAAATLPILPVPVLPGLEAVSTNWIHDFQFWDLPFVRSAGPVDRRFIPAIRDAAAGRRIVVALGRQDAAKGFPLFAQSFCASQPLRDGHLFVSAGKISPDSAAAAADLEAAGAVVFDREITDAELLVLYDLADVVWCLYDPNYDQASGIFGRSLQLGKIPILRKGSLAERFCLTEGVDYIAAEYEIGAVASALLIRPPHPPGEHQHFVARGRSWRDRTVSVLQGALFGDGVRASQSDARLPSENRHGS